MDTQHKLMIENVINFSKKDARIIGLAIGGSYITKSIDQFSDLDFIIVVAEEDYDAIMEERMKIISKFGTLIASFTGEHVGEPRLVISLFSDPLLHVDFKFCKLNGFIDRVEDPIVLFQVDNCLSKVIEETVAYYPSVSYQWIENRFWVWVHYTCTKIGRGELFEVIDFLSFMRQQVLGTMISLKKGNSPRGVRKLEFDAPEFIEDLVSTVPNYDVKSCKNALLKIIIIYKKLRDDVYLEAINKNEVAERKVMEYFETL